MLRDLDRDRTEPTGSTLNKHPVARFKLNLLSESLNRGEQHKRQRRSLGVAETRRQRRNIGGRNRDLLRKSPDRLHAGARKHRVARFEASHSLADRDNVTGKLLAERLRQRVTKKLLQLTASNLQIERVEGG